MAAINKIIADNQALSQVIILYNFLLFLFISHRRETSNPPQDNKMMINYYLAAEKSADIH